MDHWYQREPSTRNLPERSSKRVIGLRNFKGPVHESLHISIPFITKGLNNAVTGDGSYQITSAHNWEIVLQCMHCLVQSILKRVRRRKGGEVGQHDLLHTHVVYYVLEEQCAVFDMGSYKDEEANQHRPNIGVEQPKQREQHRQTLANTY